MSETFTEFWDWYCKKHNPYPYDTLIDPKEVALAAWARGVKQGYRKCELPPRRAARGEIARLREALGFYAADENWDGCSAAAYEDGGRTASTALEQK